MFIMKWISILIFFPLLFSCNKQDQNKEQPTGFSFGNPLSANRDLNKTETAQALEACSLLRDKREYFETLEDNRWEFEFKGEESLCGGSRASGTRYITRLRVPSSGPLVFDSRTRRYLNEILTDKNGFLSHYCEDLFTGMPTKIIQQVGGKKLQLTVSKPQSHLLIEGAWYYPDDRGVFKPYLLDKVLIHTKGTTDNRRYYGVAKDRAQHRPCDDGSVKYLRQTLL